MVRLLGRGWRDDLGGLVAAASRDVLVAAPYIKSAEAAWLCDQLRPGVDVLTLANIDANSLRTSSLDLAALRRLAGVSPASRVVSLSHLHAKVFVADEVGAIVTSGNLTRSGLDRNLEYGVLFDEPALIGTVRRDMLLQVRLGRDVDEGRFAELASLETELREKYSDLEASAEPGAQRRLDEVMGRARREFASTQVGDRSRNAMFGDAILVTLERGPQVTPDIHEQVRALLPALCDEEELVINGERYGKAWKHHVRNAQQQLRRRGMIERDESTGAWSLSRAQP